jgi:RNA polymerase sigma factor for flagellar operon FliA
MTRNETSTPSTPSTMSRQDRDQLIVRHLPLVRHVLGRMIGELPSGIDVENLESAGVLGLVEAAAKFDPDRNAQFKTFAYLRVRGAILDELRRNCPLPQHMLERVAKIRKAYRKLSTPVTVDDLCLETGMTPDEVSDSLNAMRLTRMISWEQTAQPNGLALSESVAPPEEEFERWERIQMLGDCIEQLPARERMVVTLYYREELRLKEISQIMHLSESRISRILSAALFELGEKIRARERKSDEKLATASAGNW